MSFSQFLKLIVVMVGPVEHHELIIGGEHDVLWDLGQSVLVVKRVQESCQLSKDIIIKFLHDSCLNVIFEGKSPATI